MSEFYQSHLSDASFVFLPWNEKPGGSSKDWTGHATGRHNILTHQSFCISSTPHTHTQKKQDEFWHTLPLAYWCALVQLTEAKCLWMWDCNGLLKMSLQEILVSLVWSSGLQWAVLWPQLLKGGLVACCVYNVTLTSNLPRLGAWQNDVNGGLRVLPSEVVGS